MAVTLTAAQLAVELRLIAKSTDTIPAGQQAILDRHLAASSVLIDGYASAAPTAVANEAAVRLASYLYDRAGSEGRAGNPMITSGSAHLLARYRTRTVTVPTARSELTE